jgi:hypothetical protein
MRALKYLPITCGPGMIFAPGCILTYDLYREMVYRRVLETPGGGRRARHRWWFGGGRHWRWRCWHGVRCWWPSALWSCPDRVEGV